MTAFERRQSGAPRLMSESGMACDWWKWEFACMVGAHCVRDRDGRALFTLNSLEAVASEYMGSTRYSRRRHLAACTQGLPLVRLSDRRGRNQVKAWDVRALITLALDSDPDLATAVYQEVDEENCADAVADILEEAVLAAAPAGQDSDEEGEVEEEDFLTAVMRKLDEGLAREEMLSKQCDQYRYSAKYWKKIAMKSRAAARDGKEDNTWRTPGERGHLTLRGQWEAATRRNKVGHASTAALVSILEERLGGLNGKSIVRSELKVDLVMRYHSWFQRRAIREALLQENAQQVEPNFAAVQKPDASSPFIWEVTQCKADGTNSELVQKEKAFVATLFQTWSDGSKYGPEVLDLVPIMHGTAAEALAIFRRLFERSGALSWTEDLRQKLHLPDTTSFLRVIWFGTDHGSDMVASVNAVKREAHDGGGGCVPASAQGGTGVATEDGDTPVEGAPAPPRVSVVGAPAPPPGTCASTHPICQYVHRLTAVAWRIALTCGALRRLSWGALRRLPWGALRRLPWRPLPPLRRSPPKR